MIVLLLFDFAVLVARIHHEVNSLDLQRVFKAVKFFYIFSILRSGTPLNVGGS